MFNDLLMCHRLKLIYNNELGDKNEPIITSDMDYNTKLTKVVA